MAKIVHLRTWSSSIAPSNMRQDPDGALTLHQCSTEGSTERGGDGGRGCTEGTHCVFQWQVSASSHPKPRGRCMRWLRHRGGAAGAFHWTAPALWRHLWHHSASDRFTRAMAEPAFSCLNFIIFFFFFFFIASDHNTLSFFFFFRCCCCWLGC